MTRQQQKAATRSALRTAARTCFAGQGYAGATVAEIAHAAGVATGTFYVHFESKEAVLESLLEDFNQALAATLTPILSSGDQQQLESMVRDAAVAFLDHWLAERDFVASYVERSGAGLSLQALRDGINPPALELLVRALGSRLALTADPLRATLVAQGLLASWLRIGLQYLFNEAVDREAAADVLVAMTIGTFASLTSCGERSS